MRARWGKSAEYGGEEITHYKYIVLITTSTLRPLLRMHRLKNHIYTLGNRCNSSTLGGAPHFGAPSLTHTGCRGRGSVHALPSQDKCILRLSDPSILVSATHIHAWAKWVSLKVGVISAHTHLQGDVEFPSLLPHFAHRIRLRLVTRDHHLHNLCANTQRVRGEKKKTGSSHVCTTQIHVRKRGALPRLPPWPGFAAPGPGGESYMYAPPLSMFNSGSGYAFPTRSCPSGNAKVSV